MKFKEFLGSGPAGIIAGAVTVLLGGGAVAALAFSSTPDARPMGDARLSSANQAFDALLVANAGANDVRRPGSAGGEMADGSPVAGPESDARRMPGGDAAAAGDGSSRQSRGSTSSAAAASPGSAAYYRSLLSAGSVGAGLGTLAMMPRGGWGRGGNVAGNLGRSGSPDLIRDRASTNLRDPLTPSRAFSSYGANDAGSSSVKSGSSGRPASGTTPVGPLASNGAKVVSSTPAASAPPIALPAAAPSARPPAPPAAANVPSGVLAATPAPAATDPLGEHANGGNTPPKPGTPPPTASVVGADAIVTPEPGTWLLVGSGLLALGLVGRRRLGQLG